jgi:hypothetical protein
MQSSANSPWPRRKICDHVNSLSSQSVGEQHNSEIVFSSFLWIDKYQRLAPFFTAYVEGPTEKPDDFKKK